MIFCYTWNKIQIPSGFHSLARPSGHKIRHNRTPSRESWYKDHKMGRSSQYLKNRKKPGVISHPTTPLSFLLPSSHSGFISVLSYLLVADSFLTFRFQLKCYLLRETFPDFQCKGLCRNTSFGAQIYYFRREHRVRREALIEP